jgi:hypothetical protein
MERGYTENSDRLKYIWNTEPSSKSRTSLREYRSDRGSLIIIWSYYHQQTREYHEEHIANEAMTVRDNVWNTAPERTRQHHV